MEGTSRDDLPEALFLEEKQMGKGNLAWGKGQLITEPK